MEEALAAARRQTRLMARVRVNEIFHSIQGESTWAGLRCAFVASPDVTAVARGATTEYASTRAIRLDVAEVRRQG